MTLPDPIGDAVRWLTGGGLLAYPTETVWGLAADADSPQGLGRLRAWKGRADAAPVSVLVESLEVAREAGFEIGAEAERLARAFWPGPLTLVVPARGSFAPGVAREDGAVGLRCSSHPLARALARRMRRETGGFFTSTSLNATGAEPARSAAEARVLCGGGPDAPLFVAVEGAEAGGDAASTVVDVTGQPPRVLRWGAVARAELEPLLQEMA